MKNLRLLTIFGALLLLPNISNAVSIGASEYIYDTLPFEAGDRNLTRERDSDTLPLVTETNDATIIAENLVSSSFGVYDNVDVSFQHDLSWLAPPASNFLNATLTIFAFGPLGSDDTVFVDTINVGTLTNGLLFTSSVFSSNNSVLLNGLFSDNVLSVFVNKNIGGGFANLNLLSVYGSKLEVTYETEVPEPASIALLGAGLSGLLIRRRKRSA